MQTADLKKHPFATLFTEGQIEKLLPLARWVEYQPGEALLREGSDCDQFYLLVEGLVSIDLDLPGGGSRRLQTEGAGTEIGWSWLFPPYEATFDIRAVEPSKLIALDAAKLRNMMDTDQDFGNRVLKGMLKTFVGRLGQTRLQLLDIHSHRRVDK